MISFFATELLVGLHIQGRLIPSLCVPQLFKMGTTLAVFTTFEIPLSTPSEFQFTARESKKLLGRLPKYY